MTVDPLQVAPTLVVAVMYGMRVRHLARLGRPVGPRRIAWFYAGLAVVLVALVSPLHELGETRLFYAHMSQHLLLGDIAPLLIVLGLNGAILRPLLAFPPVRRLRWLAHPSVALPLWIANLYAWHLTSLYEAALAHDGLHALQHELFFLTGALMWAAVIEPLPGPAWFGTGPKTVYTLVVRTAGALLASVFIWAGHPFYPVYGPGEAVSGIEPLADQTIGGLIMFTEGGMVTLAAFAWLFMRWTRDEELEQSLVERGHKPALAARAARYRRSPLARATRR